MIVMYNTHEGNGCVITTIFDSDWEFFLGDAEGEDKQPSDSVWLVPGTEGDLI